MKWNVYDEEGNFLGTIRAESMEEAIEKAAWTDMPTAHYARPRDTVVH